MDSRERRVKGEGLNRKEEMTGNEESSEREDRPLKTSDGRKVRELCSM